MHQFVNLCNTNRTLWALLDREGRIVVWYDSALDAREAQDTHFPETKLVRMYVCSECPINP